MSQHTSGVRGYSDSSGPLSSSALSTTRSYASIGAESADGWVVSDPGNERQPKPQRRYKLFQAESVAPHSAPQPGPWAPIDQNTFNQIDVDGNGVIDRDEWTRAAQALTAPPPEYTSAAAPKLVGHLLPAHDEVDTRAMENRVQNLGQELEMARSRLAQQEKEIRRSQVQAGTPSTYPEHHRRMPQLSTPPPTLMPKPQPSLTAEEPPPRSSLRVLFSFMDKAGRDTVSKQEMIIALRHDPLAPKYLGLPSVLTPGTPAHAAFEGVFQRLEAHDGDELGWKAFEQLTAVDDTTPPGTVGALTEQKPPRASHGSFEPLGSEVAEGPQIVALRQEVRELQEKMQSHHLPAELPGETLPAETAPGLVAIRGIEEKHKVGAGQAEGAQTLDVRTEAMAPVGSETATQQDLKADLQTATQARDRVVQELEDVKQELAAARQLHSTSSEERDAEVQRLAAELEAAKNAIEASKENASRDDDHQEIAQLKAQVKEANEALKEATEELERSRKDDEPQMAILEAKIQALTPTEAVKVDEAFKKMDVDGDGLVSHKEFTTTLHGDEDLSVILSRGIISQKGKRYLDLKEISRLWHMIDKDLDDGLTLDEMKALWHEGETSNVAAMTKLKADLEAAKAKIDELQKAKGTLTEVKSPSYDVEGSAAAIPPSEAIKELQEAQHELQQARESETAAKKELAATKAQIEELAKSKIRAAEDASPSTTTAQTAVESDSSTKLVEALKKDLELAQKELEDARESEAAAKREVLQITQSLDKPRRTDDGSQMSAESTKDPSQQHDEIAQLKAKVAEANKALTEATEELERSKEDYELQLAMYEDKAQGLKADLQTATQAQDRVVQELEDVKQELAAARQLHSTSSEERDAEVQRLAAELEAAKNAIEASKENASRDDDHQEIAQLKAQVKEANEALKEATEELERSRKDDELQMAILEAKIQALTPTEAVKVDEAFKKMDVDGDGLVSHKEFTTTLHGDEDLSVILSRGIISQKGKRYLDLKEISRLWHMIDKDLDDGLTLDEMKALWHEGETSNVAAMTKLKADLEAAKAKIDELQKAKDAAELSAAESAEKVRSHLAEKEERAADAQETHNALMQLTGDLKAEVVQLKETNTELEKAKTKAESALAEEEEKHKTTIDEWAAAKLKEKAELIEEIEGKGKRLSLRVMIQLSNRISLEVCRTHMGTWIGKMMAAKMEEQVHAVDAELETTRTEMATQEQDHRESMEILEAEMGDRLEVMFTEMSNRLEDQEGIFNMKKDAMVKTWSITLLRKVGWSIHMAAIRSRVRTWALRAASERIYGRQIAFSTASHIGASILHAHRRRVCASLMQWQINMAFSIGLSEAQDLLNELQYCMESHTNEKAQLRTARDDAVSQLWIKERDLKLFIDGIVQEKADAIAAAEIEIESIRAQVAEEHAIELAGKDDEIEAMRSTLVEADVHWQHKEDEVRSREARMDVILEAKGALQERCVELEGRLTTCEETLQALQEELAQEKEISETLAQEKVQREEELKQLGISAKVEPLLRAAQNVNVADQLIHTWSQQVAGLKRQAAFRNWELGTVKGNVESMGQLAIEKCVEVEEAEGQSRQLMQMSDMLNDAHKERCQYVFFLIVMNALRRFDRDRLMEHTMVWWAATQAAAIEESVTQSTVQRHSISKVAGARLLGRVLINWGSDKMRERLQFWAVHARLFSRSMDHCRVEQKHMDNSQLQIQLERTTERLLEAEEKLRVEEALMTEERENWANMMEKMENELKDTAANSIESLCAEVALSQAKEADLAAQLTIRNREAEEAVSEFNELNGKVNTLQENLELAAAELREREARLCELEVSEQQGQSSLDDARAEMRDMEARMADAVQASEDAAKALHDAWEESSVAVKAKEAAEKALAEVAALTVKLKAEQSNTEQARLLGQRQAEAQLAEAMKQSLDQATSKFAADLKAEQVAHVQTVKQLDAVNTELATLRAHSSAHEGRVKAFQRAVGLSKAGTTLIYLRHMSFKALLKNWRHNCRVKDALNHAANQFEAELIKERTKLSASQKVEAELKAALAALETESAKLKAHTRSREEEVATLSSGLNEATTATEKLVETNTKLKETVDSMEGRCRAVEEELAELKTVNGVSEQDNKLLTVRVGDLEQAKTGLTKELEAARMEQSAGDAKRKELEDKTAALEAKLEEMTQLGGEARENAEALLKVNQATEEEIQRLQDQLGKEKQNGKALANELNEAKSAIEEATATTENLTQVSEELEETLHKAQERVKEVEAQNASLMKDLEDTKSASHADKDKNTELDEKVKAFEKQREEDLAQLDKLANELETLSKRDAVNVAEIERLKDADQERQNEIVKNENLSAELVQLKHALSDALAEAKGVADANKQAEEAKDKLAETANDLEARLEELQRDHANQINEAQDHTRELEDRIKELEAENKELAEEMKEWQEHLAQERKKSKALTDELNEANTAADEANEALERSMDTNETLKGSVDKAQDRCKELEQELAEARKIHENRARTQDDKVAALEKEHEDARPKHQEMHSEAADQIKQLEAELIKAKGDATDAIAEADRLNERVDELGELDAYVPDLKRQLEVAMKRAQEAEDREEELLLKMGGHQEAVEDMESLKDEIEVLKGELGKVLGEAETFKDLKMSQITMLEDDLANKDKALEREKAKAKRKLEAAQVDLDQANAQADALAVKIQEMMRLNESLKKGAGAEELEKLSAENSQLLQQLKAKGESPLPPPVEASGAHSEEIAKLKQELQEVNSRLAEERELEKEQMAMLESKIDFLTPKEAIHLRDAFTRMDVDGNGVVSHEEFVEVLRHDEELCQILSRGIISRRGKSYLDLKETAQLWEMIDKDLDDGLSLDEMQQLWREAPTDAEEAKGLRSKLRQLQKDLERMPGLERELADAREELAAVTHNYKRLKESEERPYLERVASVLSRDDFAHMVQAFHRMDDDGNGVVSHEEFASVLHDDKELCLILSKGVLTKRGKEYLDLKETSKLWHLIDKDLDDGLTLEELTSTWQEAKEAGKPVVLADDPGMPGLVAAAAIAGGSRPRSRRGSTSEGAPGRAPSLK